MSTDAPRTASRGRLILARALVVIGLLIGGLALLAGYVNWQVFDKQTFETTASELIADDAIRSQIASDLADQLYANVDVKQELENQLPEDQKGLAGPIAGALRQVGDRAAYELLGRPRVQDLFVKSTLAAHEVAIRALEDDLGPVETRNGKIVLDLRAAVVELGNELSFVGDLSDRLPADVGVIEIADADQFETAQEVTNLFRKIAVVLPFVFVVLVGAGIWLARGRRRRELRAAAIGTIVVGVLLLVLRSVAGGVVVDDLSPSSSADEAVRNAWNIITSLLADGAWTAIILGIGGLIGVWLSSSGGLGRRVRYGLAPILARRSLAYACAAAILLVLIWWEPTAQFGRPLSLLIFAGLLAAGVEALHALVVREDPTAATADISDRLRGIAGHGPDAFTATTPSEPQTPPPPRPPGGLPPA